MANEAKKSKVKPATVSYADAQVVLKNFFNNPTMTLVNLMPNQEGGITFFFQDPKSQYPVKLNKTGLFDVVRFGLEALAENHD